MPALPEILGCYQSHKREKMGGKVSRPGQGVIRCTLPSGTTVDCSFGTGGTVCAWKGDMSTTSVKQLMGDRFAIAYTRRRESAASARSTPTPVLKKALFCRAGEVAGGELDMGEE